MAKITRITSHIDETLEVIHALERLDLLYGMEKDVGALGDKWTFTIYVHPEEEADEQEANNDPLLLREAEQAMRKDMESLQQAVGADHVYKRHVAGIFEKCKDEDCETCYPKDPREDHDPEDPFCNCPECR